MRLWQFHDRANGNVYFTEKGFCSVIFLLVTISRLEMPYMTRSQFNHSYESGKWIKVKVAKCCWKKWNGPFLMHIYDKQCEIMQKNNRRAQTFRFSVFTIDVRSSLLKLMKTGQIKTHVSQFFQILWPIQDATMSKSMARAFQICITHRGGDDFTLSYRPSKSTQISFLKKAEMSR